MTSHIYIYIDSHPQIDGKVNPYSFNGDLLSIYDWGWLYIYIKQSHDKKKWDDYSQYFWENKIDVPNHQPDKDPQRGCPRLTGFASRAPLPPPSLAHSMSLVPFAFRLRFPVLAVVLRKPRRFPIAVASHPRGCPDKWDIPYPWRIRMYAMIMVCHLPSIYPKCYHIYIYIHGSYGIEPEIFGPDISHDFLDMTCNWIQVTRIGLGRQWQTYGDGDGNQCCFPEKGY